LEVGEFKFWPALA